jgi:hypothetical protein
MAGSFQGLAVGLEAVPQIVEKLCHHPRARP